MRNIDEIEAYLKETGCFKEWKYFLRVDWRDVINDGLRFLAVSEDIVKVIYYSPQLIGVDPYENRLCLFTTLNRVFVCGQRTQRNPFYNPDSFSASFGLSKEEKWVSDAQIFDFNHAILDHTTFQILKKESLFRTRDICAMVSFEFEERNILSHLSIRIPVEEGKKVYREIMKHIEKYSHHETPKATVAEESAPPHGDGGSVREIRDMYESGIITKEEMMELLKETVKNK